MNLFNSNDRRRFLLPLTSVCAVCVALGMPAFGQDNGGQGADPQEPQVTVTDFETVDIFVQDADLAQVLQMLSLQSRKNIISSRNVSATVTANLHDVTFHEALDAILKVNGFTYEEQGNFIYVYTMAEYKEKMEAQRQRVQRIFDLDHLSAQDALRLITPLLSENGQASANGEVAPGMQPSTSDGGADGWAYNVKIVVFDYPENLEMIQELVTELDTAPQQVLVEAAIVQTTVDEADAFGIDFSVIANMDFTDIFNPLAPVTGLLNGSNPESGFQPADNKAMAGQSTVGNTSGPGTMKIGVVSNDISVFLRVLDQVTDTTVLARPKVMALNRQRAEVLVGARVGYLSTTATETTTTQTVQFLDTGIQLIFRPFISKDGTIRMELRPSVSEASLRTVTDSVGSQVTIPDELTNEITTNVRVRDGQTLILGGLFREATSTTRRQVPLLGDVPILGAVFRGQDDRVERSEIIFLLTPTITHDEVLWKQGNEALAFAELVRIGAREGLLPFSRDKMTAAHNQHAVAAHNAGDTELALYHIRNSLRLNSRQPNVISMLHQLSGDADRNYERGMLERILHPAVERIREENAASYSEAEPENTEPAMQRNPLIELHSISDPAMASEDENAGAEEVEAAVPADIENETADAPVHEELQADDGAWSDDGGFSLDSLEEQPESSEMPENPEDEWYDFGGLSATDQEFLRMAWSPFNWWLVSGPSFKSLHDTADLSSDDAAHVHVDE